MFLDRTVPDIVDGHVRSAIPPLLDELLPALVRNEVVASLATVDDESPSDTALKGAISSAVSDRLATTFPADVGVDARAARLYRSRHFRYRTLNRLAPPPELVRWPLTRRVSPFSSQHFMVLQERPQKIAFPHSPVWLAPAGQKTAWKASRQKNESRIGRLKEAQPALKNEARRAQKNPRRKTQDVATGRRTSTARDAISDTAMPEGAVAPPIIATPSRMVRVGATPEIATRATDVGSGEKTPIRTATLARRKRRPPSQEQRPPVCPGAGSKTVARDQAVERPFHQGCRVPHVSVGKLQRVLRREHRAANQKVSEEARHTDEYPHVRWTRSNRGPRFSRALQDGLYPKWGQRRHGPMGFP